MADVEDAAQRGQRRGQHEHDQQYPVGADAGGARGFGVAADGVQRAAVPEPAQRDDADEEDEAAHPERRRLAEPGGVAEVPQRRGYLEDRRAAADAQLQAAQRDEHAQRPDERVDPDLRRDQPVDQADQRTDQQAQRYRAPGRQDAETGEPAAVCGYHEPRREYRCHADGRLQRQVHPAGDQDHRLAEDQQAQLGALLEHVGEVAGGEEVRADDEPDQQQQADHRDQREVP